MSIKTGDFIIHNKFTGIIGSVGCVKGAIHVSMFTTNGRYLNATKFINENHLRECYTPIKETIYGTAAGKEILKMLHPVIKEHL